MSDDVTQCVEGFREIIRLVLQIPEEKLTQETRAILGTAALALIRLGHPFDFDQAKTPGNTSHENGN